MRSNVRRKDRKKNEKSVKTTRSRNLAEGAFKKQGKCKLCEKLQRKKEG